MQGRTRALDESRGRKVEEQSICPNNGPVSATFPRLDDERSVWSAGETMLARLSRVEQGDGGCPRVALTRSAGCCCEPQGPLSSSDVLPRTLQAFRARRVHRCLRSADEEEVEVYRQVEPVGTRLTGCNDFVGL